MFLLSLISYVLSTTPESILFSSITNAIVNIKCPNIDSPLCNEQTGICSITSEQTGICPTSSEQSGKSLNEKFKVMGDIDTVLQESLYADEISFDYFVNSFTETYMSFTCSSSSLTILRPRGKCRMTSLLENQDTKKRSYDKCTKIDVHYEICTGFEINFLTSGKNYKGLLNIASVTLSDNNIQHKFKLSKNFEIKLTEKEGKLFLDLQGLELECFGAPSTLEIEIFDDIEVELVLKYENEERLLN